MSWKIPLTGNPVACLACAQARNPLKISLDVYFFVFHTIVARGGYIEKPKKCLEKVGSMIFEYLIGNGSKYLRYFQAGTKLTKTQDTVQYFTYK